MIVEVWSIGHQTSGFDKIPGVVHCRHSGGQGQSLDLNLVRGCPRTGNNVQGVGAALERLKNGQNIFRPLEVWYDDFQPERAGRCLNLMHLQCVRRIVGISQERQSAEARENFSQEFKSLTREFRGLECKTSDVASWSRKACD